MKIISFLGTGNYQLTTYLHPFNSQKKETRFFQEALVEFYQPEILYVLLTPTVINHPNWQDLQMCLEGKVNLQPIDDIPERNTPEDVWTIFEEVTKCFNTNDRIIFDVTHSFRSIPIVSLLAVSYLRIVKNITIESLLYGAYEAKNSETNETPTFDLLPVVKLLDWIAAADRFTDTGDGKPLVSLLSSAINPELQENNLDLKKAQNSLDNVADKIRQVSQALALARPTETLGASKTIEKSLDKAHESIAKYAKPFDLVKDKVLAGYGQFALTDKNNLSESLWSQLKMISWFMERDQVMQAMTLAREWVVSLLAYRLGENDLLDEKCRKETENALHNGNAKSKGDEPKSVSRLDECFASLSEYQQLSDIWDKLTEIRNDFAHVGMRKGAASVKSLRTRSEAILPELQKMAETLLQSNPE
ncbi:MAG: TIGR02221 family CRISPR-associated protein [Snowella sp.]|nr:TIGR02221 family CRISPR-associated protein [Snowella sp.]